MTDFPSRVPGRLPNSNAVSADAGYKVYLAAAGLAGPASGSKYQKRVIFKADFDSLRGIFLVKQLIKLRKYRYLRKIASSLTLFVMRVYKSIKIGSLREKF